MFPYHYGSYATLNQIEKYERTLYCFHTTMVLTQQHRIHCVVPGGQRFHTTMVLTQLTMLVSMFHPMQLCFHTTMVLTQRISAKDIAAGHYSFPYHYGSYATDTDIFVDQTILDEFPYHYGSYATRKIGGHG